jgi:hypothetical protein
VEPCGLQEHRILRIHADVGRVRIAAERIFQGPSRSAIIDAVEVSPGEPAVFEPGGLHVTLIDLTEKLEEDSIGPLTPDEGWNRSTRSRRYGKE